MRQFDASDGTMSGTGARLIASMDLGLSAISDPTKIPAEAIRLLGEALDAERVGYALADVTVDTIRVESLWSASPMSVVLGGRFADFATSRSAMESARPAVSGADEAASPASAGVTSGSTRWINIPVIERGQVIALLFVHAGGNRPWTEEEVSAAQFVADRIRAANEQARIEAVRRDTDEQLLAIADAMPIQVWAADNTGMLYWFNRRVVEYCGIDRDQLDGLGYQQIMHPDDLPVALENWYQALEAGTGHDVQFRIRGADGTYRWFLTRSEPIRDASGAIIRWIGTNTDIQADKDLTAELGRRNHSLSAEITARTRERDLIWKTSSDLFAVADTTYTPIDVNPAWTHMLGWTERDMHSRHPIEICHVDDRGLSIAALDKLVKDGDRVSVENRLLKKDGSQVWLLWNISRFDDRIYATGRDITALRDLIKAQNDLAHASRIATLGEMAASIAHEVNQPLAAISTNGHAARRWLDRPEPDFGEVRQALERMMDEAHRASEIISRIRSLAMRGEPNRQTQPIHAIVEDSLTMVRAQARSLGASLSYDNTVALPDVLADRIQIQQVLINLILNAAQAMASADSEERRIDVTARALEASVELAVLDTGPGISREAAVQVFSAFFTTKADGMGMGLSIAKSIVEAHGGTLRIDASNMGGTCFVFDLPCKDPETRLRRV